MFLSCNVGFCNIAIAVQPRWARGCLWRSCRRTRKEKVMLVCWGSNAWLFAEAVHFGQYSDNSTMTDASSAALHHQVTDALQCSWCWNPVVLYGLCRFKDRGCSCDAENDIDTPIDLR